jgi:hypothetical protein
MNGDCMQALSPPPTLTLFACTMYRLLIVHAWKLVHLQLRGVGCTPYCKSIVSNRRHGYYSWYGNGFSVSVNLSKISRKILQSFVLAKMFCEDLPFVLIFCDNIREKNTEASLTWKFSASHLSANDFENFLGNNFYFLKDINSFTYFSRKF